MIVILEDKQVELRKIESNLKKRNKFRGGAHGKTAYSPQFCAAETQEDRYYQEHLNKYYQQIISVVGNASSLFVFGAGEAKHELEKQLAHKGNRIREIHVEAADKMTERQIAAKVRKYFEK